MPQLFSEELEMELDTRIRIDVGLTEVLDKSRTFVQNLINEGHVLVNGETVKANYKIRSGDKVRVRIPEPRLLEVLPENISLKIVFEDEDLLVVNKAQGMVVHPAPGALTGTLVNALMYHCTNLSGINGVLRPGIVHRIDKDTSGLLVVAKNDFVHGSLSSQLKDHSVVRKYLVIVHGVLSEPGGTIDAPIGRNPSERKQMAVTFRNSKRAVTHYTVLERFKGFTYLEARLETGRTHQIRVHMAYIKHAVLGDSVYGPKRNSFNLKGQMLHAAELGFAHPRSGKWLQFSAPLPQEFEEVLNKLRHL
ncbi:MAG: RluA family pseudouridine synthase [Desulfitobacteriaceae bacterium]|nr:RluA family pseudouridine synthase [Desulfitobacteriaceae bacterium]MDD4346394.1 RluA family pseudouridine synthase [Desulfitobacteriaceae bacterium]MDD4401666.1 RluA family pseudouridine synthase [Desulfitobacteriaceae bacterium]